MAVGNSFMNGELNLWFIWYKNIEIILKIIDMNW